MYLFINFILGLFPDFQRKRHVFIYRHIRIKRVVLKHHRKIAILCFYIITKLSINPELPARNLLKTGNHPKRRRFSAAGRSNKNHKLPIRYFKRKILNRIMFLIIRFTDILQHNI